METPNTNWMDYDPGDLYCQCEDPMEMIDGTCARCLRHVDGVIIEVDDDERIG